MMDQFEANDQLISALVERWRPETHTFHFPIGECTVTLEDVAVQLGVRIDGRPVIGSTSFTRERIEDLCQSLLGIRPEEGDINKSTIRLTWLHDNFNEEILDNFGPDVSDEILQQFTRAYKLQLLGMRLTPDKTTSLIHCKFLPLIENFQEIGEYSWGSACLAVLYRNLCRATRHKISDFGGCLVLLQSWAWHRLLFLAPISDNPVPRLLKRITREGVLNCV